MSALSTPSELHLSRLRAQAKARRESRAGCGLCIMCGKRPPRHDRVHCQDCADKLKTWQSGHLEQKRLYQRSRRERLGAAGLCLRCGRVPPREGVSLCEGCKDRIPYAERASRPTAADMKIAAAGRCKACSSLLLPRHDCPGAPPTAAELALGRRSDSDCHVSSRRR